MGVRTTGCHHMAFVTNDMEKTVKFYHGLLGFPVVVTLQLPETDPFPGAVPGNLGGSRHYFFRIGDQDTIAFFEFKSTDAPANNALLGPATIWRSPFRRRASCSEPKRCSRSTA